MRWLVFSVALLSGCATTQVGDLEVLNDMGRGGRTTGEVLRTVDSSCKVLTGYPCDRRHLNTPQLNRTYGEIKQLPDYRRATLPIILQQVQVIVR